MAAAKEERGFSALNALGLGDSAEIGKRGLDLLLNPKWATYLVPFLLVVETVLCSLIIRTVGYTEIDWKAYMQQIEIYLAGERNYTKIHGDTGPLVYPAMHVYIYRWLYEFTQGGTNILLAQVFFAVLYIFTLGVVMACYRRAKAPPYIYPMLILSKRLHSIFLLRCFNDCFAISFLFLAIYFFQRKQWDIGAIIFSLGLGVKMSLLLALPAIVILLYQASGPWKALGQLSFIVQVQLMIAIPFLRKDVWAYLGRAFELTRTFKYEWTVNWKFLSEETFLSPNFSRLLIILHLALLALFITTRWMRPLGRSPRDLLFLGAANPSPEAQRNIIAQLSSDFILTSILTSISIGALCARSLHYQFYSWIAWGTPFLLYKSKINPLLQVAVWFGQELAWNQYPPNELSSRLVVGCLAVVVVQVWNGTDEVKSKTLIQARNEVFEHLAAREREDRDGKVQGQVEGQVEAVEVGKEGSGGSGAQAEAKKAVKRGGKRKA